MVAVPLSMALAIATSVPPQHGFYTAIVAGAVIATLMAGAILVALRLSRLGSLIQYVPYPVILGFTAGIGVVIALLQLPDFLGLAEVELGDDTPHNLMLIGQALPSLSLAEVSVGLVTLATLLMLGGIEVDTIASRFSWEFQGESGSGISSGQMARRLRLTLRCFERSH